MDKQRYTLYDDELEHVFAEKDLGLIIDMKMTFDGHMATKLKKANWMMG